MNNQQKLVRFVINILIVLISISLGWFISDIYKNYQQGKVVSISNWNKPKPLEKYTIENLSKIKIKPATIEIIKNIKKEKEYSSDIFSFEFDPTLTNTNQKTVTGLINVPTSTKKGLPIVVLVRGYVDVNIYETGVGTKRVGEYLASNGYITLAPDFLGYASSSKESENIFESRFQTYTTLVTLLSSINSSNFPDWDGKNIFIWAHSNGGQIALTTLEITGYKYPTVLWAPVTESFPYSILFYTNESEDQGKYIRRELSKFESEYDANKFSLTNYLDRIQAPIEYHLGTNDDAIPLEWRDRFVAKMKSLDKNFKNYNHPGADHNMNPLWGDVMQKTLEFFNDSLEV